MTVTEFLKIFDKSNEFDMTEQIAAYMTKKQENKTFMRSYKLDIEDVKCEKTADEIRYLVQ